MKKYLPVIFILISAVNLFSQAREKDDFLKAENRFQMKNYELALDLYEIFISEYPLSVYIPEAYFKKAICLFRMVRLQEALELFQKIESRYVDFKYRIYIPYWIGNIHYKLSSWEESLKEFDRFLVAVHSSDSGSIDREIVIQSQLYKALGYMQLKQYKAALLSLETLFSISSTPEEHPYASMLYLSLCIQTGAYENAVIFTEHYPASGYPEEWRNRILLYTAEAHWNAGSLEKSENIYKSLLRAEEDIAVIAYQKLFTILQQKNSRDDMLTFIYSAEQALVSSPEILIEFWLRIGILAYKDGDYKLSEVYLIKIWNIREEFSLNYLVPLYLSEIYIKEKKPQLSVEILKEFLNSHQNQKDRNENIYLSICSAYALLSDWKELEYYADTCIKEYPYSESLIAGYWKAYSLYRQEKYEKALEIIQLYTKRLSSTEFSNKLLHLRALCEMELGRNSEAVNDLENYLATLSDPAIYIDLLKLLFKEKKYYDVIRAADKMHSDNPLLKEKNPELFLLSGYFTGLAHLSLKDYIKAEGFLKDVSDSNVTGAQLDLIKPYALYYNAWAVFRNEEYSRSAKIFDSFTALYPDHELSTDALYNLAWCYYQTEEYSLCERRLKTLISSSTSSGFAIKASFLLGKTHVLQNKNEEAALVFQNIFIASPGSIWADDAVFEYAAVLSLLGKARESSQYFYKVFSEYPESTLKEEALFKRAEILYNAELYKNAGQAYYEFRLHFPDSAMIDTALYWGSLCSFRQRQDYEAVLLLEEIIKNHRNSPFYPDALIRSAEFYYDTKEYRKSFDLYTQYASAFPEQAEKMMVEQKLKELQYLLLGLNNKEAALLVIIEQEGRTAGSKGLEAMLELCSLYISEHSGKEDSALTMLKEIIAKTDKRKEYQSRAYYLLGEYFYLKNNLNEAGNSFLKAAVLSTHNRDFMAHAMYRAAEMARKAGSIKEAEDLVKKIKDNFPDSEWARKGEELLKGGVR